MLYDDRDRRTVRNAVLAVTALAWVLLIGTPDTQTNHHALHGGAVSVIAVGNWLLMVGAMMAPVLIQPIQFVRGSSFTRRRTRSTVLFVAGYTTVWMLGGVLLLWLAARVESLGLPPYVPVAAIILLALVWQCSPPKQVCLNRCHALRELSRFGRAADIDALTFGAEQGIWCAGSCWAWMGLPLPLPAAHTAAMAAASVLIFCERLEAPAPVGWRWRGLGRARRIIVTRIKTTRKPTLA